MDPGLKEALDAFTREGKFTTKGPLSVALVVTQHAKRYGLPLDKEKLVTEGDKFLGSVRQQFRRS